MNYKCPIYPGIKIQCVRSHDIITKGDVYEVEKVRVHEDGSISASLLKDTVQYDFYHAMDYRWRIAPDQTAPVKYL